MLYAISTWSTKLGHQVSLKNIRLSNKEMRTRKIMCSKCYEKQSFNLRISLVRTLNVDNDRSPHTAALVHLKHPCWLRVWMCTNVCQACMRYHTWIRLFLKVHMQSTAGNRRATLHCGGLVWNRGSILGKTEMENFQTKHNDPAIKQTPLLYCSSGMQYRY